MLIIDSHNAEFNEDKALNLHLRNSIILKNYLNADLVTLPKHLKDKDYKKVIFIHASAYSQSRHFIDYLEDRDCEYFYIVNDYNLGEPDTLWRLCKKKGIKFTVIANHNPEASKVTTGTNNIKAWHVVNLNSIIFKEQETPKAPQSLFFNTTIKKPDIMYFGAFRKGRIKYFRKYFDRNFHVSTSKKNVVKYTSNGINAHFRNTLNWWGTGNTLFDYKASLYIEDEKTHKHYSCMANRFYEALSYNIPTFFDVSCMSTIEKSGYPIDPFFIVETKDELMRNISLPYKVALDKQKQIARAERENTLRQIRDIIC